MNSLISLLAKITILIIGLIVLTLSFFFVEEDKFSTQETSENINKKTNYTKLTNTIYHFYFFLTMLCLILPYLLPSKK
jgi:ABC-type Fe3+ transport system permease subunit